MPYRSLITTAGLESFLEEWHWMQQAEMERRREEAAFREAWRRLTVARRNRKQHQLSGEQQG